MEHLELKTASKLGLGKNSLLTHFKTSSYAFIKFKVHRLCFNIQTKRKLTYTFRTVMLTKKILNENMIKRQPVLWGLAVLQCNSTVYTTFNFLQYNHKQS